MQGGTRACEGEEAGAGEGTSERCSLYQQLEAHTELLIQHHLHQWPPVERPHLQPAPVTTAAEHWAEDCPGQQLCAGQEGGPHSPEQPAGHCGPRCRQLLLVFPGAAAAL